MGMMNSGQRLAAMGQGGDTMLAHINPREAMMLKMMGGSGTINPRTGLPQFFTAEEYLRLYPDVAANPYFKANPQAHWDQYGQAEGRNSGDIPPAGSTGGLMGGGANQVSSPSYEDIDYLNRYTDVAKSGMTAQQHYNLFGKNEGRTYGVQTGGGEPVPSYIVNNTSPPASPTSAVTSVGTTGGMLGGVQTGGLSPVDPYQAPGGTQTFGYTRPRKIYSSGVDPNKLAPNQVDSWWKVPEKWDPKKYLSDNPDLADDPWATANPLAHYALFGAPKEGRQWGTGGYANTDFKRANSIYLAQNKDVADDPYWSQRPWEHYQTSGKSQGRQWYGEEQNDQTHLLYTDKDFKASEGWDPKSFLAMHPELKDNAWAQANPLAYAALFGKDMATPTFTQGQAVDYGSGKHGFEGAKVITQQLSEDGRTRRSYLSNGTYVDNTWDPTNTHILGQEDRGNYWLIYTDDGSYTTVAKEDKGGIWGQATKVFQAPAKWTLQGLSSLAGGGNNDFQKMVNKLNANEEANSWGAMINSIIEPTQTTGLFAGGTGKVLPKEMKEGTIPQVIEGIAGVVYPVVGPMAVSGLVSQFNEENPNDAWTKAGIKGGSSYAAGAIAPYVSSAASFAGTQISSQAAAAISTAIVTTAVQKGIYNQSWEDSIKAGIIAGTINYVGGKLVGKFTDAYGNIINLGANGEPSLEPNNGDATQFSSGSPGQAALQLPPNALQGGEGPLASGFRFANSSEAPTGFSHTGNTFGSMGSGYQFGQYGGGTTTPYSSPFGNSSYFNPIDPYTANIYENPGPFSNMRNLYYQNNMPANIGASLRGAGFEGGTDWGGEPNGPPLEFAPPMEEVPPYQFGGEDPFGNQAFLNSLSYGRSPLAIPGYQSPLEGTIFGENGGFMGGFSPVDGLGYMGGSNPAYGSTTNIPWKEIIKLATSAVGGAGGSASGGATPGGPKKPGEGGGGPNGGLLSLDEMPIPEYMKKKLKRKAMAAGKTWEEYLADATKNQKSYYGAYLA